MNNYNVQALYYSTTLYFYLLSNESVHTHRGSRIAESFPI